MLVGASPGGEGGGSFAVMKNEGAKQPAMLAIRADKKRKQMANAFLERQPSGFDRCQRRAYQVNGVLEKPIMKSSEQRILCGKARVERAHRTSGDARQLGRGDGIEPLVFEQKCERPEDPIARRPAALLPRQMAVFD